MKPLSRAASKYELHNSRHELFGYEASGLIPNLLSVGPEHTVFKLRPLPYNITLLLYSLPLARRWHRTSTVNVTYSSTYDDSDQSTYTVNCSAGLIDRGYTTFGSLPSFPNIGAIPNIIEDHSLCGTCWQLNYTTTSGDDNTIYFAAIDTPPDSSSFIISQQAFDDLTSNDNSSSTITAVATQVNETICGM
ncbi:hypothetical protein AZE42_05545 [Rhizopogon vesiculosus]|uniref:Barwin domain-containing protein n=1 Tax=Rhizopogon vesiculosus TaxID=180088 RepID=A0A1J8PRA1_9AGAM|nr:hypothetical protein AZE42_05545 [Rhizopogon vesiculosus]